MCLVYNCNAHVHKHIFKRMFIFCDYIEGVQSELPQNVLFQHVEYFELKAIKIQQTREKLYLSLN